MQYSLFQPVSCTLRDSGELSPMDKLRHAGPHALTDAELISLFASPRSFDKIREQLYQYRGIRGLIGIAEPSQADRQITLKLTQALALVDVRVLDHLVVGDKTVTSMAERGLM